MANKTQASEASVEAYLTAITDEAKREDCKTLIVLLTRVTQAPAIMWGNMVGFGQYRYRYASGREGDWFLVGFAARKSAISVYLTAYGQDLSTELSALGKHKMDKSCLHIRALKDIDLAVLERVVQASVAETKRRYPGN